MHSKHELDTIVIVDGGIPAVAQAVARQVRDLAVYCEVVPARANVARATRGLRGVIAVGADAVPLASVPTLSVDGSVDEVALREFVLTTCGCRPGWTPAAMVDLAVAAVREQVGSGRVLCALSGGVDSSVAAALVHRAVGDQLVCVFVDHGLLRKGEAEQVVQMFREQFQLQLVHVQAEERFLARLAGVTDPEEKRKRIGAEFIRVFEEEARKLGQIEFLLQGTIYPDVLESDTIKSHHNVGGLPDDMKLGLVEPLRMLFKDEVRAVGETLGLPASMVWRQPFPGPGLGIRIIGEVTAPRLALLREADAIVREEIAAAGLDRDVWQYFAVLTPIQSVGVRDGVRSYEHLVAVRAVTSRDATRADWARLPYELLDRMSTRICAEVPGVNRVVYDITGKPPGTIEWE